MIRAPYLEEEQSCAVHDKEIDYQFHFKGHTHDIVDKGGEAFTRLRSTNKTLLKVCGSHANLDCTVTCTAIVLANPGEETIPAAQIAMPPDPFGSWKEPARGECLRFWCSGTK